HLLENAVTYTPAGGIVRIHTFTKADEFVITVSDSGIGIPAEELPQIFTRFYRGAIASHMQPVGTGLGLAIVSKVVEQHHGRVEVESQIGSGATFKLYLPLVTK
ncbi:MAG: sensor histidine kinase, partial [Anaerolineales bacterium]|nr:sensor histidine kinase [Anaerolineales bacterium]